ncbi:MAG: LacI family DNA-binding transcriptional regulator [Chloroflexota bacterium]
MTVTIRDVAKRLNLSITTVSRALDGYSDVAQATRQLVVVTAREMGYVPNRAARQLRRQRADTIGYILPASSLHFSEPFYTEFVSGLGDQASLHNCDVVVSTAPPNSQEERQVYERWVQGRKVDGVILNRVRLDDWRIQFMGEQGFPFAALERPQNLPAAARSAYLEVDNRGAMVEMVRHLTGLGHRRIAYIGGPAMLKIQVERQAGFEAGIVEAGLPLDPQLICSTGMNSQGGYERAMGLLDLPEPPSAIACINDSVAFGVLHAAYEHGLAVGRQLSVTGFDGVSEAEHTQPPLTTLNLPLYQIARRLVDMLLALVEGSPLPGAPAPIQPELQARGSTGAPV